MLTHVERIILLLAAAMALSGCGQKGPLFLPGDPDALRTTTPNRAPVQQQQEDEEDEEEPPPDYYH